MASSKGLLERLGNGEQVVCAAGISSEIDRRGLVWMDKLAGQCVGSLTFEDHVRQIYEDFVHCGSDAIIAWPTAVSDSGDLCDPRIMKIARLVGDNTQTLVGASVRPIHVTGSQGDKNNTLLESIKVQTEIALTMGADFIIGEDFSELWQAKSALERIKEYSKDVPVVVTLSGACHKATRDGVPSSDALRALEESGADVVGLGNGVDPVNIIVSLTEARKTCKISHCDAPLGVADRMVLDVKSGLAVEGLIFSSLHTGFSGSLTRRIPLNDSRLRTDVQEFGRQARCVGIEFVGLFDGSVPNHVREVAETFGRLTPGSKFSPDLSQVCKNISNPTPQQAKRRLHQLTQEYAKFQGLC